MGELARSRTRWASTGRRNQCAAARCAYPNLGGYCLRFRAPPRSNIWCRHLCSASCAVSIGDELVRGMHRRTVPNHSQCSFAIDCCHPPAPGRICTQLPCLCCAVRHWPPLLNQVCGDLCLRTCYDTSSAIESSEIDPEPANVARHALPNPLLRLSSVPPTARTACTTLAPPCAGLYPVILPLPCTEPST